MREKVSSRNVLSQPNTHMFKDEIHITCVCERACAEEKDGSGGKKQVKN